MHTLNVLIVEDSENDAILLAMELRHGGWLVSRERVDTLQAMSDALSKGSWDLIIADYSMPQFSGTEALALARRKSIDVPFLLVSGTVGEATAVSAMKAGADDYLFKGDLHRLVPVVEREIRAAEERRRAAKIEELLHKRETQLSEALRLARLGTWHVSFQDDSADWSDEACRLLGCASANQTLTFKQFLECLHPEDREEFDKAFADPGVSQIARDCRLICPHAVAKFVNVLGKLVRNEQGELVSASGMIQDITERKLIDAELLRLKETAEAASRAKSEFLANMSHELRTPMSAILGFADMMTQTGEHVIDQLECLAIIRRNSQHLLELINEILDISKIEAGQMTVERIQCDLPCLLSDVAALMQSRAAEKSLHVSVKIAGPLPHHILTDPLRLRQILVNLWGNAIKFTATGTIELVVKCESSDESSTLVIEVRDTGIGMTGEQMSRLFEPFVQAEGSTTRKFGGTGLGLAISRRLARLLKGDITVSSQLGVGSIFHITVDAGSIKDTDFVSDLPSASVPAAQVNGPACNATVNARVLLAEDGRDNQKLLSTHLKMAGAQVEIVENGQLALDRASSNSFDVILMDMQMPLMDGYSATAELRRRGVQTPIIALTAYAMSEDRAKCLACGCTDYLSKPLTREALLMAIHKHLGQSVEPAQLVVELPPIQLASPPGSEGPLPSSLRNYPGMSPLIDEFVDYLPGTVDQLNDLLEKQELQQLQRLAHQLRGAGGGFGFDPVTEAAANVEDAIKSGQAPLAISIGVDSLIKVIKRVEGFDTRKSRMAA